MSINKFYTVVVIKVDLFESSIVDEKHFGLLSEAESFKSSLQSGLIGVIAEV